MPLQGLPLRLLLQGLSDVCALRRYADCRRTPIGSTVAAPPFPIVAIVHPFRDHEGGQRQVRAEGGQNRVRLGARRPRWPRGRTRTRDPYAWRLRIRTATVTGAAGLSVANGAGSMRGPATTSKDSLRVRAESTIGPSIMAK